MAASSLRSNRSIVLAHVLAGLSILLLILLLQKTAAQDLEVTDDDTAAAAAEADAHTPLFPDPPKPVASDPAIPALLQWLHSKRVNTSAVTLIDTPHGRGLATTRAIRANATLFTIPHSLLLTADYVQDESALSDELAELEPTDAFALWLAHHRNSTKTLFHPYIASLPHFTPLPLFFAPTLADEYRNTQLEELATQRRGMAYGAYERLSHDLKGLAKREHFLWAISQLWSRTFGVAIRDSQERSGWRSVAALVPLADMLNTAHPHAVNVRCRTSKAGTSFQCTALRSLAAGEELLVSYGPKANAQLMHDYGFALHNNTHDYANIVLPSPKKNHTVGDTHKVSYRKMEVEEQWNKELKRKESLLQFRLTAARAANDSTATTIDDVLGAEVYGWARLNVIDAADVSRLTAYEMIEAMRSGRSFSRANDLRAIRVVLKSVQTALASYPYTLAEDEAAVSDVSSSVSGESGVVYWCQVLRVGEMSVLSRVEQRIAVEIVRLEAEARAEIDAQKREKEKREAEKRAKEEKEKQRKLEKERQRREEDAREALKKKNQEEEEEEEEEDGELDWLDGSREPIVDMRRAMAAGAGKPVHNELR